MGAYIKGMKMPDHCWECWLMRKLICGASGELIPSSGKLKHCPLVDLEKPGWLIDEKEVPPVMDWILTQPQRPTWNDLYHAIQEMLAVIEAEDGT
jgi:hypothetical protein